MPLVQEIMFGEKRGGGVQGRSARAERMGALGVFAAGIAHDLRNLLSIMEAALDALPCSSADKADEGNGAFRALRETLQSADHLTQDLLGFARRIPMEFKVKDLNTVILSGENLFRQVLPTSITLRLELAAEVLPVNCDQRRLEHALLNLCSNARDAIPKGGTITIRTGTRTITPTMLERWEWAFPGEAVFFSVADTGEGIPAELLPKIFDPFFTTKASKGAGIGLASVLGTAKQHGGFVDVDGGYGRGAEFTVYLPRFGDAKGLLGAGILSDELRGTRESNDRPMESLGRVVIADDLDGFRATASALLESYGVTVATAGDWEALENLVTARKRGSKFTVLLDWSLGGEPRPDRVVWLQAHGCRVVILTGDDVDAVRAKIAAPVFGKPVLWDDLLEHLREGSE